MTSFRTLLRAVLAAAMFLPGLSQALVLRADFSGTSHAEQTLPGAPVPVEYYDGQPITGWFEVEIAGVEPVGDINQAYWFNSGSQRASYTVRGQQFDFFSEPEDRGVIVFSDWNGTQWLDFRSNIMPKYHGASFDITGPSGSLFDVIHPDSIHILPGAAYSFSTGFADGTAAMRVGITLDQMDFRVLTPVPEPSTALLLLGGGAALMGWQRRRKPGL